MIEPDWVSLREFSRRRGVALSAVQKAIDSGRVTAVRRNARGHLEAIDARLAAVQWDGNTDPVEALKNGKLPGQQQADESNTPRENGARGNGGQGAAPALGPERELPLFQADKPAGDSSLAGKSESSAAVGDAKDFGYLQARATTEQYRAKQAELDYLEKLGLLVAVGEVERETAEIFSQLQTSIYQQLAAHAQEFAAETDPIRMERLLREALRKVFHEFSGRLAADAPGGATDSEEHLPA